MMARPKISIKTMLKNELVRIPFRIAKQKIRHKINDAQNKALQKFVYQKMLEEQRVDNRG